MKCCVCGNRVIENSKLWVCENPKCGLKIWKEVGGRQITREIAEELLKNGKTGVLEFKSREGKTFSASLVIKDGRVKYEFPGNRKGQDEKQAHVRVEAGSSGRCYFAITGSVNKQVEVNFGLVSAAEAECLALLTAARYVGHCNGGSKCFMKVSLNNLNLSRYVLKERSPRDRRMKELVNAARKALDQAGRWEVEYKPERRPRLKGGPLADTFPPEVFPWLDAKVWKENGRLVVELPDDPAVRAQFKAAMYSSTVSEDGFFILPETAEKAVYAWVNKVKGGPE